MEVLFHLVEDEVLSDYLGRLFDSAERFVVIVSSDKEIQPTSPHEHHRRFTDWVSRYRPEWRLEVRIDPPAEIGLLSSCYFYMRE
jgi:hypothetical protein